jgi:hypothetical protein
MEVVAGGELTCTIGTSGVNCTGSLTDWSDTFFGAYDYAVRGTTDFLCWINGV